MSIKAHEWLHQEKWSISPCLDTRHAEGPQRDRGRVVLFQVSDETEGFGDGS